MGSGVYAIVHLDSGRQYIGSSVNIRRRWATHRRELRRGSHSNRYLQAAWSKYGEDAFAFSVVEDCPPGSVVEREQAWLDAVRPHERDRGFNLSPSAYSILGYRFTPEQRRRVSVALLGVPKSEEAKANMRGSHVVTDAAREWCAELGRASAGKPKSQEHRRRIGERQRGSSNHKAKLSEANVVEIHRRLAAGERGRHLAAEFGVHESIISEIKTGRRWRHVTNPTSSLSV